MKTQWATKQYGWLGGVVLVVFAALAPARAAEPLVDAAWLAANVGKPGIAVLDLQSPTDFLRGHVPGAQNIDYYKDGWKEDRADKVPEMFPEKLDRLLAHIGRLGIDNDTHVVIVPPGTSSRDMAFGTRIYWTFKVLGHDKVSLLDGGMAAYARDKKYPIETGAAKPAEAKVFRANPRREMIATVDDVRRALAAGTPLVDIRDESLHVGVVRSPKVPDAGTLPGAKNVPHTWLTVNAGGQLRNRAQLEHIYRVAGVPVSGDQIVFCNTGHLSSLGWFVASELLGNKKARMYDGSMAEWSILKAGPIEQKVKLP